VTRASLDDVLCDPERGLDTATNGTESGVYCGPSPALRNGQGRGEDASMISAEEEGFVLASERSELKAARQTSSSKRAPKGPAEEEGFEPTVPLRVRRFSNSVPPSARGCTDGNPREREGSETKSLAPSGTERHRDQGLDQVGDHETKPILGLEVAAERLLRAVAEGATESVELARQLVMAVLQEPLVRRAVALDELLRKQSPLALVRAVELADAVSRSTATTASDDTPGKADHS
jgi:hypothetical protein